MHVQLDPASPVPLYGQLIEQIRLALASGILRPGDRLPGIRELAERAAIHPMTVVRAFNDLISEGVLIGRQGSGTFVAERESQKEISRGQKLRIARRWAEELAAKAYGLGLSKKEALEALAEGFDALDAKRNARGGRR